MPARKPGKLPHETVSAEYALEYGIDALEVHADALAGGAPRAGPRRPAGDRRHRRGAVRARRAARRRSSSACAFLIELSFLGGRERLAPRPRARADRLRARSELWRRAPQEPHDRGRRRSASGRWSRTRTTFPRWWPGVDADGGRRADRLDAGVHDEEGPRRCGSTSALLESEPPEAPARRGSRRSPARRSSGCWTSRSPRSRSSRSTAGTRVTIEQRQKLKGYSPDRRVDAPPRDRTSGSMRRSTTLEQLLVETLADRERQAGLRRADQHDLTRAPSASPASRASRPARWKLRRVGRQRPLRSTAAVGADAGAHESEQLGVAAGELYSHTA